MRADVNLRRFVPGADSHSSYSISSVARTSSESVKIIQVCWRGQEVAVPEKPNAAKAQAEATFQKKEHQRREGEKARAEYESEARARDENTARLRALRLAKEAADRKAGIEVAAKEKARPKLVRNPRSNLR
jgi:hypothetical protein